MIGSLRGTLLERSPDGEVLVEVGGVGYRVVVTPRALAALVPDDDTFLYIHHHIREDAQTLYGFAGRDERDCFEALLGAHGVGPALALAILSVHTPEQLRAAVRSGDLDALCLVPGVGRKTAARLLLELQARLDVPDGRRRSPPWRRATATARPALADVREALAGLGYGPDEVREVLRDLPPEGDAVQLAAGGAAHARSPTCVRSCSSPSPSDGEQAEEAGLRPRRLDEFVGQAELKEHLTIVLEAARRRGQAADHLLLAGPPGLGKTTLAGIVATEMGVRIHVTSGPALERAGDLAAILTKLDDGDVLFIDEIHRLPRPVEEILYPAMEDFQLDIVVGKGPAASSIRLDAAPLHPGRGHHPHRADHRAAAGPLRARGPARLLRAERAGGHRRAVGRHPRRRDRRARRGRDRRSGPGHAPHRQPAAAARPRLRRGPGRRHGRPRRGPAGPGHLRRRRAGARQGRPGHPRHRLRAVRRRAGRAVDGGHQRRRAARDRRGRLRAVPHPAGPAHAHARGRVATPAAFTHVGVTPPARAGEQRPPELFGE